MCPSDDVEDAEKYVAVPSKYDLDLATPLVMDFVRQTLPRHVDEGRHMFRRKGAYARFKAFLARSGALEQWYEFERVATERALRGASSTRSSWLIDRFQAWMCSCEPLPCE